MANGEDCSSILNPACAVGSETAGNCEKSEKKKKAAAKGEGPKLIETTLPPPETRKSA